MAPDLEKRPVVLKITGILEKPEGPLTLYVPEKGGKNKEFKRVQLAILQANCRPCARKKGIVEALMA